MPRPRRRLRRAFLLRRPLAAGVSLCIFVAAAQGTSARAEAIRIAVGADQTATIDGRSASLKDVIAELCERAGVRLIGYQATNREVAAHYSDVPLKDLLPRLLKQESFVVGLRTDGAGTDPVVSTLRVIGDKTGVSTYAALPPERRRELGEALSGAAASRPHKPTFQVPPDVLNSAFRSSSPLDHEKAAGYISERLLGDAESRRRFLDADPGALAGTFGRYEHSVDILSRVRDVQEDSSVIAKLDEIILALRREGRE